MDSDWNVQRAWQDKILEEIPFIHWERAREEIRSAEHCRTFLIFKKHDREGKLCPGNIEFQGYLQTNTRTPWGQERTIICIAVQKNPQELNISEVHRDIKLKIIYKVEDARKFVETNNVLAELEHQIQEIIGNVTASCRPDCITANVCEEQVKNVDAHSLGLFIEEATATVAGNQEQFYHTEEWAVVPTPSEVEDQEDGEIQSVKPSAIAGETVQVGLQLPTEQSVKGEERPLEGTSTVEPPNESAGENGSHIVIPVHRVLPSGQHEEPTELLDSQHVEQKTSNTRNIIFCGVVGTVVGALIGIFFSLLPGPSVSPGAGLILGGIIGGGLGAAIGRQPSSPSIRRFKILALVLIIALALSLGAAFNFGYPRSQVSSAGSMQSTKEINQRQIPWEFKVAGIEFFEDSPGMILPIDQREYTTRFRASTARYIFTELHLTHPAPGRIMEIPISCTYIDPDGTMQETTWVAKIQPTWTEVYTASGQGWDRPGRWDPGSYQLECDIDGQATAVGTFRVHGRRR